MSKLQASKLMVGLMLGSLLGALGLPRFELALASFSGGLEASLLGAAAVEQLPAVQSAQATQPAPAATVVAPSVPRLLVAEGFGALGQWPNDPEGPAWFANGEYRLSAREAGNFVAVGVPLPGPVGDVKVSAQLHKMGGPPGGGYGLIVRDQSPAPERDGRNQSGQYLALAVDDRGDAGVWQRDQTHWIDIVPWTHSDIVQLGTDANALVVTIHASGLRFEVNGMVIAELTYDGVPPTGGVGIFVGGDLNEVVLDWLKIEG